MAAGCDARFGMLGGLSLCGCRDDEHRFLVVVHEGLDSLHVIVFAVAASWPLDELRRASGSALAPAVLHGAINGSAGAVLLIVGGDRLWAAPTGLLGALAFLPAGVIARWTCSRIAATSDVSTGAA